MAHYANDRRVPTPEIAPDAMVARPFVALQRNHRIGCDFRGRDAEIAPD
eukprot:gene52182-71144_t